jgi:phosphate starvation-inducible PhoH-like protein
MSAKKRLQTSNSNSSSKNRITQNHLDLTHIEPLTFTQRRVFRDYESGKHLVLHGYAGTGKSFLSLYLALKSIGNAEYKKIVIVRAAQPVRDQGFLPGSAEEKSAVYELPYDNICADLYNRDDAYAVLKLKGIIHFCSTSYIRGITLDDTILIIDEAASLTAHEINSILTRVGDNCRILFCGDYRQSDLVKSSDKQGFVNALDRLKKIEEVGFIEFQVEDIIRSSFVKNWIMSEFN